MNNLRNKKWVFCGSPQFAVSVLEGLLKTGAKPEFVITETDKPAGRGKSLKSTSVKDFALKHGLKVLTPKNKQELTQIFKDNTIDLSVVVAYGKIIPKEALDLCEFGWINVHASLLPKYRGASPVQAAILAGDTETGITFMKMDEGLDTGNVLAYVNLAMKKDVLLPQLFEELADLAAGALPEVLDLYLDGAIAPKPQDNSLATSAHLIKKSDGEIELLKDSPIELDRKFRAYYPWPGIFSLEFGERLIIKDAYLDEGVFVIKKLGFAGRSITDGKTWGLSHQDLLTRLPSNVKLG